MPIVPGLPGLVGIRQGGGVLFFGILFYFYLNQEEAALISIRYSAVGRNQADAHHRSKLHGEHIIGG